MPWWMGEDSWDDSDFLNDASADAVALFFRAQARMARQMSDGWLTVADLERLDLSRPPRERRRVPWRRPMAELVERGVFVVVGDRWHDPGWLARNRSKVEVGLQRRWDALRQQIRFAAAERKPALEVEADAVKRDLWEARNARKREVAVDDSQGMSLVSSEVSSQDSLPIPPSPGPPLRGEGEDEDARRQRAAKQDDERHAARAELEAMGLVEPRESDPSSASLANGNTMRERPESEFGALSEGETGASHAPPPPSSGSESAQSDALPPKSP